MDSGWRCRRIRDVEGLSFGNSSISDMMRRLAIGCANAGRREIMKLRLLWLL